LRGNGQIYRWLGIRFFKRYLPTSGDLVTRLRGKRRIGPYNRNASLELIRYDKVTRSYEARHLIGAVSMLLLSWWSIESYGKGNWLILIAGNMLINVYPIMLQRYNRVRLQTMLARIDE
jgi:hypothetical protein